MGKEKTMVGELVKGELEFIVCSTINGDRKDCRRDWCDRCSFKLPRLDEVKNNVLEALLDKIDELSNDGEFTLTIQEIRTAFKDLT